MSAKIFAGLVLGAIAVALTVVFAPPASSQTLSPFGIGADSTSSNYAPYWLPRMASIGIKDVRDGDTFGDIEPTEGTFNWSTADQDLSLADSYGLDPSGFFFYATSWDTGADGLPDTPTLTPWATFVSAYVAHEEGTLNHYEVWNEPPNFTNDATPAEYGALVASAYTAGHAANPSVKIGIESSSFNLNYMGQAVAGGAANNFDYVIFHPYEMFGTVDYGFEGEFMSMTSSVRKMLAALDPSNIDAPMWCTEIGEAIGGSVTATTQAQDLVKAYSMGITQGIQCMEWFESMDGDSGLMGLLDSNGNPRPAYTAYANTIEYLGEYPNPLGWVLLNNDDYGFVFQGPSSTVMVMWAPPGATDTVSFGQTVTVLDPVAGASSQASSYALTNAPVFVVGVPANLVQQAEANTDTAQPFPWNGNYTNAQSVTLTAGSPDVEQGLHWYDPADTSTLTTFDGSVCRFVGATAGPDFTVDPNFLSYTTEPIQVTAVLACAPGSDAGFNIKYEGQSGFPESIGWNTVPDDGQWHTLTWDIDDDQFNGLWGYNFGFDSDSTTYSQYYIQSITVTNLSTTPPAAPTNLTAAAGASQISLTWTGSAGSPDYSVYRGTSSGGESATPIATDVMAPHFTDTSAAAGTEYYYEVSAVTSAGSSGYSNEATATPSPNKPAAPTGLTAAAGNTDIALSWIAAGGASGYSIYRGATSEGEGGTPVATVIGTTNYTDTGLANGEAYYYKVSAINANGASAYSEEASAIPEPGSLTGAHAVAASSYNLTALGTSDWRQWGDSGGSNHDSAGGGQITDVTQVGGGNYGANDYGDVLTSWSNGIPVASSSGDGNEIYVNDVQNAGWTFSAPASTTPRTLNVVVDDVSGAAWSIAAQLSDGSAAEYTDTEVSTGKTLYTFAYSAGEPDQYLQVTLLKVDDSSTDSVQLDSAWLTTAPVPAVPTNLTATAGDAEVSLSWIGSAGASSYNIYRSTTNGTGYAKIGAATTTTYKDSAVTNGKTYYYVVTAVNGGGESGYSNQASATPAAPGAVHIPAAPTGLSAVAGNGRVTLTWNASASATGYDVYRSTTSGKGYAKIGASATLTYTDTSVTNGKTYYYVVTAVDSAGASGYSNQATAKPVAPAPVRIPTAPTGLSAVAGNGQVTLTWNASAGATSYDVYRSTTSGKGYAKIGSATTATYTDSSVTDGKTYYYVVTAVDSAGASGYSNVASATPTAPAAPVIASFPAGVNFISLPYDYGSVSLSSVLGYNDPILAVWSPTASSYVMSPNSPADRIRLGTGYWVRFPKAVSVTLRGAPASTTGVAINLSPGWNQIGDPYPASVALSGVDVASGFNDDSYADAVSAGLIGALLYRYDTGTGAYETVGASGSLEPGSGYFIDATASVTLQVSAP